MKCLQSFTTSEPRLRTGSSATPLSPHSSRRLRIAIAFAQGSSCLAPVLWDQAYGWCDDEGESTFKRALAEIFTRASDPDEVSQVLEVNETPGEFFASLVRRLMGLRSEEPRTLEDVNTCDFHELEEDQRQCDRRGSASERHYLV